MLRRYLLLHLQNFREAVQRILRQPVGSLMTIVVIAIALALPAGLRVTVNNAQALSGSWQGAADFTVYLDMSVDEQRARQLALDVQARDDVSQAVLINRADALEEFRAYSGFGDALNALDDNPLPHALVVRPASGAHGDVEALAAWLSELGDTDLVQLDTAWLDRLRSILELAMRLVDIATVMLALAVVVVIGNTIRLEINNRRAEIEVVKLVGGSDGFIRRPFLYLGFCYGLAGGLLATIAIALTLSLITSPARALAQLYGSNFSLVGLSGPQIALLLTGGALLGWAGAGVITARHLRAIEPS